MRRFMVLRRRSSTASFRHTDSAKNCMACCLMLRLLDRDVCWLQLRCVATRNEEHVALQMGSTDPFQQGGLSMDRGTIPQQEPQFSDTSAKPLDQLLACALGAPVALAEAVGNLLLLWQVLQNTFRGAFHDELGAPRARPPSRTRPVCTARQSSASRRASSSRQVATAPSRAWSPHCASREQGSLPRHAALAKLSPADPLDE